MLMRSGSFTRPRPLVEFDCGSQSTSSVLTSAAASEAARLMAVVVLPTPPFWLATAITRPMILFSVCCASGYAKAFAKSMPDSCATATSVPRETPGSSRLPGVHQRGCVSRETHHDFVYGGETLQNGEVFHVEHSCWIRLIMRLLN